MCIEVWSDTFTQSKLNFFKATRGNFDLPLSQEQKDQKEKNTTTFNRQVKLDNEKYNQSEYE